MIEFPTGGDRSKRGEDTTMLREWNKYGVEAADPTHDQQLLITIHLNNFISRGKTGECKVLTAPVPSTN